jgi:hypothetical protein
MLRMNNVRQGLTGTLGNLVAAIDQDKKTVPHRYEVVVARCHWSRSVLSIKSFMFNSRPSLGAHVINQGGGTRKRTEEDFVDCFVDGRTRHCEKDEDHFWNDIRRFCSSMFVWPLSP